jgi:hypothetical protein
MSREVRRARASAVPGWTIPAPTRAHRPAGPPHNPTRDSLSFPAPPPPADAPTSARAVVLRGGDRGRAGGADRPRPPPPDRRARGRAALAHPTAQASKYPEPSRNQAKAMAGVAPVGEGGGGKGRMKPLSGEGVDKARRGRQDRRVGLVSTWGSLDSCPPQPHRTSGRAQAWGLKELASRTTKGGAACSPSPCGHLDSCLPQPCRTIATLYTSPRCPCRGLVNPRSPCRQRRNQTIARTPEACPGSWY